MTAAQTSSGATRELLLDAGERMFAERGIHGVSLREIGLASNQRNNGVTQYHFGDKPGLIRAIFERRATTVNDERSDLLDAAERAGRSDARALIEAYVVPLAAQVAAGSWYVPFLARLQAEHQRDELLVPVRAEVNTAYERVRRQLRRDHLAHLPAQRFAIRWRIALNLAIDALADYQLGDHRASLDVFTAELIDAITALLQAPA